MATTLVCEVQRRTPIAVVALYGTLDQNSAVRAVVALRDCVADSPTALLIDVAHLRVANPLSLRPVLGLFDEVRQWPRTYVGVCGASAATVSMFDRAGSHPRDSTAGVPDQDPSGAEDVGDPGPVMYENVESAMRLALTIPVPPRETLTLSPDADAPAIARDFVVRTCDAWGLQRVAKLATLIASELVTNAVVHARTRSLMTLQFSGSALQLSVRDNDPRPMHRPVPGATGAHNGDHGRGLLILEAMADGWGTLPTATGKVVWATVDLPRG